MRFTNTQAVKRTSVSSALQALIELVKHGINTANGLPLVLIRDLT